MKDKEASNSTRIHILQHLDDLAESFLMSVFHNGRLRTMKANYTVKEGDLRVIRDEMTLVQLLLVAQNSDNMVKVNAQTT